MSGISSQALAFGKYNKYRFNGGREQQNKEFSDGSGLEWYATDFRMYDNQIGRWHVVDPLSVLNYRWSPYAYSNNNPILFNDPFGLMSDSAHPVQLPEVVVKAPSNRASGSSQLFPFLTKPDHLGSPMGYRPSLADDLRLVSAEEANLPYKQPAWQPGTMVSRYKFNAAAFKGRYLRVFNSKNPNQNPEGGWLMNAEDAAGKTPEEIKEDFAIPGEAPDQFVFVDPKNGANMEEGISAANAFGPGGANQYHLLDGPGSATFSEPMPISEMPGIVMPEPVVMPTFTPIITTDPIIGPGEVL